MVSFKYLTQFYFPLDKADFITFSWGWGGWLLYNIILVLPYIDMNPPWVYTCSPSWTPLPPPFPFHPSGSFQCTSPKQPVSCIEPGLVICFTYDNIHVSMPFSQVISPSPSPTESKRLFYTSVSLLQLKQLDRSDIFSIHQEKTLRRIYRIINFYFQSVFYLTYNFLTFS